MRGHARNDDRLHGYATGIQDEREIRSFWRFQKNLLRFPEIETINKDGPETLRNLVIGLECVRLQYLFTNFVEDYETHENELVIIVIHKLVVVNEAFQLLDICSTSVSQPCGSDSSQPIVKVNIKYSIWVDPQAASLRTSHAVFAKKFFWQVFIVVALSDWDVGRKQCIVLWREKEEGWVLVSRILQTNAGKEPGGNQGEEEGNYSTVG